MPGEVSFPLSPVALDGVFETEIPSPVVDASVGGFEFHPDLHQPFSDEFIVGFRKQFPGQIAVDIAGVRRVVKDRWTQLNRNEPQGLQLQCNYRTRAYWCRSNLLDPRLGHRCGCVLE